MTVLCREEKGFADYIWKRGAEREGMAWGPDYFSIPIIKYHDQPAYGMNHLFRLMVLER